MNRLSNERSPYLLRHANNPVDWFAWSEEAFSKAAAEDKPIFLSIGYSTCHWCHVMERESFENADIAALMNEHFVSINVDREERPDVDRVYTAFVQAATGLSGWPMSVWLTRDLKPFYGGTYYPPLSQSGQPGFADILQEIARAWRADRVKVEQSAGALTAKMQDFKRTQATPAIPGVEALARTVSQFRAAFDDRHGGFSAAPKFPRPSELLFLFREHARTGDVEAREMALRTLREMAVGGLRDHLSGGFHHYTVDVQWRVPHFEKMLYDQAQLVLAYLEAAQVSGDPFYAEVAEDTLVYVGREMTDPDGAFLSAEDADSVPPEHAGDSERSYEAEGAYYLWTADEMDALLGPDAAIVKARFGVEPNGNAPADMQQEFTGKNMLYIARSIADLAAEFSLDAAAVVDLLDRARPRLIAARTKRPRPSLDDKVLTAWNGLMIAAFARGSRVLRAIELGVSDAPGADSFLDAARAAATFIRARMWHPETGTLLRRYRDGQAGIEAYAEDYAYLIFGLLELLQADPDRGWLDWAVALQRRQDELFWDEHDGGWFGTSGHDRSLLLRMKEDYDGAEPAASSVAVMNLLTLSNLVEDPVWTTRIERTFKFFGARLEQAGRAVPMMAAALSTRAAGVQQIVLVGDDGRRDLERAVARRFLPFAIALSVSPDEQRRLGTALAFIRPMEPIDGRAAAHLCRDFLRRHSVSTVAELEKQL
jgi:uncharacterized protein